MKIALEINRQSAGKEKWWMVDLENEHSSAWAASPWILVALWMAYRRLKRKGAKDAEA